MKGFEIRFPSKKSEDLLDLGKQRGYVRLPKCLHRQEGTLLMRRGLQREKQKARQLPCEGPRVLFRICVQTPVARFSETGGFVGRGRKEEKQTSM